MAKRAKRERTRHIRRPDQMAHNGRWRIECDCGWSVEIETTSGGRVKSGEQVQLELDRAFVDHLRPGERRLYVLVDQRPCPMTIRNERGELESVVAAAGNFLMPEGVPCLLTRWHEAEGVYFGHWLEPESGEAGVLPVGEIRTADGRVLRIDSPA